MDSADEDSHSLCAVANPLTDWNKSCEDLTADGSGSSTRDEDGTSLDSSDQNFAAIDYQEIDKDHRIPAITLPKDLPEINSLQGDCEPSKDTDIQPGLHSQVGNKLLENQTQHSEVEDECLYSVVNKENRKPKVDDDNFDEADGCQQEIVQLKINPELEEMYTAVNKKKTKIEQNDDSELYAEVKKVPKSNNAASNHSSSDHGDIYESIDKVVKVPPRNYKENSVPAFSGQNSMGDTNGDHIKRKSEQYPACFLGSMVMEESNLTPERSNYFVTQCIVCVSKQKSDFVPYSNDEKFKGSKVLLELEGHVFKVIDAQTSSILLSHPLNSIRVWGIGKGIDSKEFAYVTRDPATKKHVCRVYQCDRMGRDVACMLRDVCASLAAERRKNTTDVSNIGNKIVASVPVDSKTQARGRAPNAKSPPEQNGNVKVAASSAENNSLHVIGCHYLGMIKVNKPSGRGVLNTAIDLVYKNVSQDLWLEGATDISPSSVRILQQNKTVRVDCPVNLITYLGSSTKYEKLGAFIMRRGSKEIYAHVVCCEPTSQKWVDQIKTTCQLDSTKFDTSAKPEKQQPLTEFFKSLRLKR